MTNPEFNPERLDLARRRRGMTKRTLAEALGITTMTLNNYRVMKHGPSRETLPKIVKTLGFPESFFFGPDFDEPPTHGVSFRAVSTLTARLRHQLVAVGTLGLMFSDWIDSKVELPEPDIPQLDDVDPEMAATEVRRVWALGQRPIRNIIHLLEYHGVRVFSLSEDTLKMDAYSFWRNNTPYIFLNTLKSNTLKSAERSRMDAAHELGHLVMHSRGGAQGDRQAEREAQQFGAAFLMPRESVVAETTYGARLHEIRRDKKIWNVALSNLTYRMHEVGMLTDYQYRMRFIDISRQGFHVDEPDPSPHESSQILAKVFEGLRERRVTIINVARELSLPPEELGKLMFGLVRMPLPVTPR